MNVDLVALLQQFGVPVALVIFFVWQGWLREKRMSQRMDDLQDFVNGKLSDVVADNTQAMCAMTDALKERPCLVDADLAPK